MNHPKIGLLVFLGIMLLIPAIFISAAPDNTNKHRRQPGEVAEVEIAKGITMKFCWIPDGKATLGSPLNEWDRDKDHETEHEFTTEGYWLAKYEVTQGEWQTIMGENPSYFSKTGKGSDQVNKFDTTRFPVENVSWDDCQQYLKKLNEIKTLPSRMGKGTFRLPRQDEWEYACRGGKGNDRAYYFGDWLQYGQANFHSLYPRPLPKEDREREVPQLGRTNEVGSYEEAVPHPWRLCDMHGNVLEWCEDVDGLDKASRAIRGGGWASWGDRARSAYYSAKPRDYAGQSTGFRVLFMP